MKQWFFFLLLLVFTGVNSQVGVGNTNPQASLDILASSTTSPANNDGILIPRMSNFPSNPGATRDGILIFYTGVASSGKGFYYWNQSTGWVFLTGSKKLDDFEDGKSDNDGSQDGSSIFLGIDAGLNDDSTNNYNVGIGYQNMMDNTTGQANSSIGFQSLTNNISGNNNSAIGYRSLFNNETGDSNIALGIHSLFTNTSGNTNVAFGSSVLYNNISGYGNFGTGSSALYSNTSGTGNYAFGYRSLYSNTTADNNIGLGHNTLYYNINGHTNLALGYYALNSNTTGDYNIGLGRNAGFSNTTGNNNVYLGKDAGYNHIGSNTLWIENTDADADNALIYGEFGTNATTSGNVLRTNSEFQIGNPTGTGYAFPTIDGTVNQVFTTDGVGQINFIDVSTLISDTNTQNTLDRAYDEGGNGVGRTITADNGAVRISGEDGFEITGTYGNGANLTLSGTGARLFFNPKKAAFRAGHVDAGQWDNANIGNYSVSFGSNSQASGSIATAFGSSTVASNSYTTAFGLNSEASGFIAVAFGDDVIASGSRATAFGASTIASGVSSTAFGISNTAPSWAETTIGSYANIYTPISISSFNISDKVFSIGNGSVTLRSNALTIYKSGLMNINDQYNMPLFDGINGQVMATDGTGNVTFQNAIINTDNQQIDTFSFNTSSNILTLEIEDDGQAAQTVNLSSLQDSDNQHVDTFNFNSSTNILTLEIEDDGQVPITVDLSSLNPQKANAHITINADQTTTGNGTTKVNFDTVGFDIGNNFSTTTDEFTVPENGIYRVSAQITISTTTSTGIFNIRVRVDGSQVRISGSSHSGNGSITRQINSLLELTAGQTIDISFQRATGVTINSNTSRSFFDIEQL